MSSHAPLHCAAHRESAHLGSTPSRSSSRVARSSSPDTQILLRLGRRPEDLALGIQQPHERAAIRLHGQHDPRVPLRLQEMATEVSQTNSFVATITEAMGEMRQKLAETKSPLTVITRARRESLEELERQLTRETEAPQDS
jgi:hypothetical protein